MSNFKITPSINSYYFSFDFTGSAPIDRILQSVASAGNGSHSTDGWSDDLGKDFTLAEKIQVCANFASAEFNKLNEEIATIKAERDDWREHAQRNDTPVKSEAEIGRDAILDLANRKYGHFISGQGLMIYSDLIKHANNLPNNTRGE